MSKPALVRGHFRKHFPTYTATQTIMPKPMQDHQRSFQIVAATGVNKRDFGRYIAATPRDAARKAVRQVYKLMGGARNPGRVAVCLRETTRSRRKSPRSASPQRLYFFVGTREPISASARRLYQAAYDYHISALSEEEFQAMLSSTRSPTRGTKRSSPSSQSR